MTEKPTYEELERKTRILEQEVQVYISKEKRLSAERRFTDYSHMRRTLSLIKIIDELNKEINELKMTNKVDVRKMSAKLRERMKELDCLYNISSLKDRDFFSLDDALQSIVDYIPPAIRNPEIACARIQFDSHEYQTSNFKETKWRLSQEIFVGNERIGSLEVGYIEEKPEFGSGKFIEETKHLISAIAEGIARIVERDWAETEIRNCRDRIAELVSDNG
jgi:hypothetical protein